MRDVLSGAVFCLKHIYCPAIVRANLHLLQSINKLLNLSETKRHTETALFGKFGAAVRVAF